MQMMLYNMYIAWLTLLAIFIAAEGSEAKFDELPSLPKTYQASENMFFKQELKDTADFDDIVDELDFEAEVDRANKPASESRLSDNNDGLLLRTELKSNEIIDDDVLDLVQRLNENDYRTKTTTPSTKDYQPYRPVPRTPTLKQ
jgi:hypothetical protein